MTDQDVLAEMIHMIFQKLNCDPVELAERLHKSAEETKKLRQAGFIR